MQFERRGLATVSPATRGRGSPGRVLPGWGAAGPPEIPPGPEILGNLPGKGVFRDFHLVNRHFPAGRRQPLGQENRVHNPESWRQGPVERFLKERGRENGRQLQVQRLLHGLHPHGQGAMERDAREGVKAGGVDQRQPGAAQGPVDGGHQLQMAQPAGLAQLAISEPVPDRRGLRGRASRGRGRGCGSIGAGGRGAAATAG